jgi:2'-5' RNA ligase
VARLFLALDISDEVRRRLASEAAWMGAHKGDVKAVAPENYHATVKFLGSVDEAKITAIRGALEDPLKRAGSCDGRLSEWGVFPGRGSSQVFWIGVEPRDKLKRIAEICETALEPLGFPKETREFSPHVTLARAADRKVPSGFLRQWKELSGTFPHFPVDHVTLYESVTSASGPVYKPLQSFELI